MIWSITQISVCFKKHGGTESAPFSLLYRHCNLKIALLFQRFSSSNQQRMRSACARRILETHSSFHVKQADREERSLPFQELIGYFSKAG